MADDVFRPLDSPWTGVSSALSTELRIVVTAPLALGAAAVAAAVLLLGVPDWLRWAGLAVAAVLLVAAAWSWPWAERHRRSIGYAEQDDDLLVTRGVMFRRLVAVPYGRMQYVEVSANPVERRLGIATVSLHTASTETAAGIRGLAADEARRLRNRLTELGEAHGAGV